MPNDFSWPQGAAPLLSPDYATPSNCRAQADAPNSVSIRSALLDLASPPAGCVTGALSPLEFAEAILPTDCLLAGWTRNPSRNHFYPSTAALVTKQVGQADVYIGIPGYKPEAATANKRTAPYIHSFRSLFGDIDAGPEKFEKHGNKVYRTTDDAYRAIVTACNAGAIPTPTVLVASGHGFHLWYMLPNAVSLERWQHYQRSLVATFHDAGLKIDEAAQSPTQLARLPGTIHAATGRRVEAVWFTGQEAA